MVAADGRRRKQPITDAYRFGRSVIGRAPPAGDGVDHVRLPPAPAVRPPVELGLCGRCRRHRRGRSAPAAGHALRAGLARRRAGGHPARPPLAAGAARPPGGGRTAPARRPVRRDLRGLRARRPGRSVGTRDARALSALHHEPGDRDTPGAGRRAAVGRPRARRRRRRHQPRARARKRPGRPRDRAHDHRHARPGERHGAAEALGRDHRSADHRGRPQCDGGAGRRAGRRGRRRAPRCLAAPRRLCAVARPRARGGHRAAVRPSAARPRGQHGGGDAAHRAAGDRRRGGADAGRALHPASLAGMLVAVLGVGVVLRREGSAQRASTSASGASASAAARLSARPLAAVRAE